MKKIVLVLIPIAFFILAFTSCDMPTANDITIERINADKEIDIEQEKTKQTEELTKQLEIELKILEEKKK